ncbi:hypothetical protein GCM10025866_00980 [Naasia aerilata]|uniref:Uncharacterized protein n=1 Tax=Naasia aerilata TaxID=1162966 RepID=A0ABN6XH85_9MICO|nr:hypothetical protein [Naasia aerilata]BDZ44189.1 hypothetical protein GCM10025866_00980 [Naasia aerilata]
MGGQTEHACGIGGHHGQDRVELLRRREVCGLREKESRLELVAVAEGREGVADVVRRDGGQNSGGAQLGERRDPPPDAAGVAAAAEVQIRGGQRHHGDAGLRQLPDDPRSMLGLRACERRQVGQDDPSPEASPYGLLCDVGRHLEALVGVVVGEVGVDVCPHAELGGETENGVDVGAAEVDGRLAVGAAADGVHARFERLPQQRLRAGAAVNSLLGKRDDLDLDHAGIPILQLEHRLDGQQTHRRVHIRVDADGRRSVCDRLVQHERASPEQVLAVEGALEVRGHGDGVGEGAGRVGAQLVEQRLVQVQVGLDETRQEEHAVAVDRGDIRGGRRTDRADEAAGQGDRGGRSLRADADVVQGQHSILLALAGWSYQL